MTSPSARLAEQRLTDAFRRHADAVHAFAVARVGEAAAPDVVSETFVAAWRRIDELEDPLLPWLLGAARRVIANERRRQIRTNALQTRLRQSQREGHDPETSGVLEALETLDDADQEILLLTAWFDLSTKELAGTLGCAAAAARVRLHRARRRLRDVLPPLTDSSPLDKRETVR